MLFVLVACSEIPTDEPAQLDPLAADPGIDPAISQGYTAADHVQIAPNLYLRADLYETGRYGLGTDNYPHLSRTTGGNTCVEYDQGVVDGQEDDIFVHDLDWSISAEAYSVSTSNFVSSYPYIATSSLDPGDTLELFHAEAYLFLNGEYVAFFESTDLNNSGTAPIEYLFVPCDDGYLDVTALAQVEARDGDQALSIENRADAIIECCPQE
jgi:hypothetical protein